MPVVQFLPFFLHLHSQTLRDQDVNYAPKPPVDVCTPAGVAKLLIKNTKKLSSKDLKEGKDDLIGLRSQIKHNFSFCITSFSTHGLIDSSVFLCYLSHVLWLYWSARQAAEGGHLFEKGPAKHKGGASGLHQMVRQTVKDKVLRKYSLEIAEV